MVRFVYLAVPLGCLLAAPWTAQPTQWLANAVVFAVLAASNEVRLAGRRDAAVLLSSVGVLVSVADLALM